MLSHVALLFERVPKASAGFEGVLEFTDGPRHGLDIRSELLDFGLQRLHDGVCVSFGGLQKLRPIAGHEEMQPELDAFLALSIVQDGVQFGGVLKIE